MLIEPDVPLAKLYAKALTNSGHSVEVVSHGQDAVHAADSHTPDLVILELQLAGHNGIEFLYEFRSYPEWQSIPILIVSALPKTNAQIEPSLMKQLGIVEYFYKPETSLVKLTRKVDTLV